MQIIVPITRAFRKDGLERAKIRRDAIASHVQSRDEVLVEIARRRVVRAVERSRKLLQHRAVRLEDAPPHIDDIESRPGTDLEPDFRSIHSHARRSRRLCGASSFPYTSVVRLRQSACRAQAFLCARIRKRRYGGL